MSVRRLFGSVGLTSPWSVELGLAAVALLFGLGVMPILIFYAGAATLGRYEGASLGRLYHAARGAGAGVHCLLGGVPRALWPVFALQGPSRVVAGRRRVFGHLT
jgi:hypothetical protein